METSLENLYIDIGTQRVNDRNDRFARISFFKIKLEILRRISSNPRKKFIYDVC